MPIVECKVCGNPFYAKPNWIRRGWGKFCSTKCHHETLKSGKVVSCFICNREVYRAPRYLKKSKSQKYFCSKTCQTIWRNSIVYVGPNHSNWKGGHSMYRNILLRTDAPQICQRCDADDRRILIAHHLDGNRKNNTLSNLIWLCHNCHFLVHHFKEERQKIMETLV